MARFVKTTLANGAITWAFPGTNLEPVTLTLASVSDAVKARAMVHGLVQRCSDNAADEKTAAGKRAAIAAMADFYATGTADWERARVARGPAPFDSGAVIMAMARVLFDGDIDKANVMAERLAIKREISRDEALKLFSADERVATEIARAKAAAAPAKMDADSLLGEIGADEAEEEPVEGEQEETPLTE